MLPIPTHLKEILQVDEETFDMAKHGYNGFVCHDGEELMINIDIKCEKWGCNIKKLG